MLILESLIGFARRVLARFDEQSGRTSDIFRLKVREQTRLLCKDFKGTFLDVGCGEGLLFEPMSQESQSVRVIGLDFDMEMLLRMRGSWTGEYRADYWLVRTRAQELPFRNEIVDTCVCINTMYNLASKAEVAKSLKEMARVCKSGGRLIFDIRNKENPLVFFGFKWVKLYDSSIGDLPLKSYSLKEVSSILRDIGCGINRLVSIGLPTAKLAPIILVEARKFQKKLPQKV